MTRIIRLFTGYVALASSAALAQATDNAEIPQQIAALTQSLEAAKAQVAEAEKGIEALKARLAPDLVARPKISPQIANASAIRDACPQGGIDELAYIRAARDCEKAVLSKTDLKTFNAKSVTGVGATIAAATSGATATFSLRRSTIYRSLSTRDFGTTPNVEQQRASRHNFELGVRSDINKDDKSIATIATFGQLDRLASNFAVFAEYGRDYSVSEPLVRTSKGSQWTFVSERAESLMEELAGQCRKAGGEDCQSTGLVRWIFAVKDGGFANPAAVKSYNEVYWGPPPVDTAPRFGWSVRGELSRPTFDYFPFALTRAPDPFNPGKSKTVIDQSRFPQDFGSRVTKDEAHINWALTGKAFFHVSTLRAKNYTRNHGPSGLVPYVDWETGTTFFATASYVRKSEIQKPFQSVSVCPGPLLSGTFSTSQLCTSVNIAGPTTTDSLVLGGEIRQGFEPFWFLPPTLLSARYTRDFTTKENGLVVPLYFAEDDKGIFKSGLQFAHKWGGVNADGSRMPAQSVFGVVVGLSVGLDGTKN